MLEIDSGTLREIKAANLDDAPSCSINHQRLYKNLQEKIRKQVNSQLKIEEYYLSEHDTGEWYFEKEAKKRLAEIKRFGERTLEQKEKEIHARVMAEIFNSNSLTTGKEAV